MYQSSVKIFKVLLSIAFPLVQQILLMLKHPAVVVHHVGTESAMTLALHLSNVLLEPFSVHATVISKVIWEVVVLGVVCV